MLVYVPLNKAPAFAVVWYNGQWHKCYSEAKTYKPFLGPIRVEVHVTNIAEESQPDEPAVEESTTEDEREADVTFQYTPAIINTSSPGGAHREDREPWVPLITPTTDKCNRSPLSATKQPKDTMGSATIAITSTTTTAPTAPTAATSRTGTGGTGGGATPSGGATNTDAQNIRDAFDAALH